MTESVPVTFAVAKVLAEKAGVVVQFRRARLLPSHRHGLNTFGDRALVAAILEYDPWLVGFTCYLWNIERISTNDAQAGYCGS
jgi:hypothetical protein